MAKKLRGRGGKLLLKGHKRQVSQVAVSSDGARLASVDWLGGLCLWAPWQKAPLLQIQAHEDRAQGVCFLDEGRAIATCGWDRRVRIWDTQTLVMRQEYREPPKSGWHVRPWWVGASPDGRWLGAYIRRGRSAPTLCWPVRDGEVSFSSPRSAAGTIRFLGLPDHIAQKKGGQLVARSLVGKATAWTLALPELIFAWAVAPAGNCVAFCCPASAPRGGQGGGPGVSEVRVHEVASGTLLRVLPVLSNHRAQPLCFSADGRLLAGCAGREVRLWDLNTGEQHMPEGARHGEFASGVVFHPERALVSAGWDRSVRMWDLTATLEALPEGPPVSPPVVVEPEAPAAPEPEAPAPDPRAEAPAPDGVSDLDALYLAGYYRAALAGYKRAATALDGLSSREARAYQLVDVAACHLRLGEAQEARQAHRRAQDARQLRGNLFNAYAWTLYERGLLEKARRLSADSFAVLSWSDGYKYCIDTWLRILSAQRDPELIPQLACHRLEMPEYSDAMDLFEAHAEAIDAFLARPPSEAERALMRSHYRRIHQDWGSRNRLGAALTARDPERWVPEVVAGIEGLELHNRANPSLSAIPAPAVAERVIRARVDRWLDSAIRGGKRPALRPLVADYVRDGARPVDLVAKLRPHAIKHPGSGGFYDVFCTGMALAGPLGARLELLGLALDGGTPYRSWARGLQRSPPEPISAQVDRIGAAHPDGYLLLADIFGRDEPAARQGFAHMVAADLPRTLDAVAGASARAQQVLLPAVFALHPDASLPTAIALAGSSSKAVRACVAGLLISHRPAEESVRGLLSAGRKAARQVGREVLDAWGVE